MVRIENITHGYADRTGGRRILYENASLAVGRGELLALMGRNGAGKSTLLKSIAGLQRNIKGDIFIGGCRVGHVPHSNLARLVSFVSTETIRVGNLSVRSLVAMGRSPYTNWTGRLSKADRQVVSEAIKQVGMSAFELKDINTLSDGERQRVMIARALAQNTPVILFDEPTAFLDIPNKYETVALLRRLSRESGKTILFSTHDLSIAMRLADSVCIIDNGRFISGTPSEMTDNGALDAIFRGASVDIKELCNTFL